MCNISSAWVLVFVLCGVIHVASSEKAKADPHDNKGNTPFFLQDPYDQTCLGPHGFTVCDERSLWILTRRADRKKTYSLVSLLNPSPYGMCLERKSSLFGLIGTENVDMGLCSKGGSKNWQFEFADNKHIQLSTQGQCLVRGKKKYKNSVSVQSCKKTPAMKLIYHPVEVHTNGFFLKAADGACFDGAKFRSCEGTGSSKLLWGIGIKYIGGKANRYFFNFADHQSCVVAKGSKVSLGSCTAGGAYKWGLADGRLSINNDKMCVARKADNSAEMARCSEANEFIQMDIPATYTPEEIEYMLQNQVWTYMIAFTV